ncbi:MAG: hypothetical protein P8R34_04495 [archaeon]|nr:hypothetical protein [archaeon]
MVLYVSFFLTVQDSCFSVDISAVSGCMEYCIEVKLSPSFSAAIHLDGTPIYDKN